MKKELNVKAGFLPQIKTLFTSMMDMEFSFERSLEISRFLHSSLEKEVMLVEAQRIKLCNDLAKKDEKGIPLLTEDKGNFIMENPEEFNKKYSELLNVNVVLGGFNTFTKKELSACEKITPRQVMILEALELIDKDPEEIKKESIPVKEESKPMEEETYPFKPEEEVK